MKHIQYCTSCNQYTMKEQCDGIATITKKPPKFSPDDKLAKYRRVALVEERKEKGLL